MNTNFDQAVQAFEEPLVWRQDKTPHASGTLKATVLHGQSQSENAGPSRGTFAADPWTVLVSLKAAIVSQIAEGDTLTRLGIGGERLSVQQISRDETGYVIICTSNERAKK